MQSSNNIENFTKDKLNNSFDYQLTLLKFVEQPFTKSTKAIGLYSITEDYFEQDVNSVFCKNTEFVEAGKTIDKNRSNVCLYKGFIPYNPVHCRRQTEEP